MLRWQLLALALTVCSTGSAAYNYKCIQAGQDSDVVAKEFMMASLMQKMPGCSNSRHFCSSIGVLYTDRQTMGSDAYIAVANRASCESYKAHIVDALNHENTKIGFNKIETSCSGVTVGNANHWLGRGYTFRGLLQCYDNMCQLESRLADWQKDQRSYCIRFLRE